MNEQQFRRQASEHGYGNAEVKEFGAQLDEPMHSHDASIMAFVLSGEITLVLEDGSTTYGPGDWCELAAGTMHTERYGRDGATILLTYK